MYLRQSVRILVSIVHITEVMAEPLEGNRMEYLKVTQLVGAIVYSGIGLAVFWLAFIVIDMVTPYQLWKEICEKQNRALAIVIGAVSIGISLIIAAAIH